MAINFPDSPSTNDTHTVGDKTWTWNGTYWHLNQNSSTYYAQDGVPSDPDGGDFWFESDTGQLFVRYDSAWVEIGHATDFGSSMSDADGDTLIQLEEGSDEDIIRFDTGGTERMTIAANGAVNVGGTLTAGAFSGPLTGNVTGNASGSSGSSTGNAATATALATGRTINGVSFDGTGNITVTAAAGTLSGSTLASGVTASSLTSVGTLTLLSFANTAANKVDFYHSTGGSGDRYGIQVQSSELRIHSGASGVSTGGITFGKSTTSTFTERMRITNAGNVGIGTASPAHPLDVVGASHTYIGILAGTNSSAGLRLRNDAHDWDLNCRTDDKFAIYSHTSGATRFSIDTSGNVGIGTTSPAAPLQVNTTASDAATIQMNTTHATSKRCRLQFAYGGTQGWEWGTDLSVNGGTELYAYNRASGVIAMVIKDDGKVGIGTSTPGLKLHVYTTASTDGILLDGSTFPAITLQGAGTTRGYIGVATGSGGFVNNSATGDVIIRSNGAKLHLATSQTAASLTCNSSSICIADAALHSYTTWGAPKLQVHGPAHIKNWTGTPASSTELLDWPHSLLHITTKSNYAWARLQSWGYSNDAPYNTTFDTMWNLGIYQNSTNNISVSNSGTDLKFAGPGAFAIRAGGAERFLISSAGAVTIGGSLSKGSGTFDIAHPVKGGDWRLRHSFIEGPQADLIYRGTVTLSGGAAAVDLDTASHMTDGTWEALCRDPWAMVASSGNAVEWSLSGKTLTITSDTADAVCSWMVIAERQDDHMKGDDCPLCDDDGHLIVEYEKEPDPVPFPEVESA